MKTAKYVDDFIAALKGKGTPLSDVAWEAACLCVGWPYVFGAWGEYCDPVNRRKRAREDHPTIKSACINFNGSDKEVGKCEKCKWYPDGRVRFFDCRGFTYWVLKQVYGWKMEGGGATAQWNTASNWAEKGTIDTIPNDKLVCLFIKEGNKMSHTGFGYHGKTVECSVGVQKFSKRDKKWTHWAIPACVEGIVPIKPTLKRGNKGEAVKELQTLLVEKGYNIGGFGIDGNFGKATEAAVKEFQKNSNLTADGIVGKKTWAALLEDKPAETYLVCIPNLTLQKAQEIVKLYPDAYTEKENK